MEQATSRALHNLCSFVDIQLNELCNSITVEASAKMFLFFTHSKPTMLFNIDLGIKTFPEMRMHF
jgi:hypothetical protein